MLDPCITFSDAQSLLEINEKIKTWMLGRDKKGFLNRTLCNINKV